jgi:two-component system OmpR family response regulator
VRDFHTSILLVDDEAAIREVLGAYLRQEGFHVFEAADGVEGVDAALRERPDLVVLDIGLPRLSGIEALRQIRAEQDVPVILLTARSSEAERVLGLELGADDYVGKPFSLREVAARIKSVLRRYGRYGHNAVRAHDVVRVASLEIDRTAHEVRTGGSPVRLTPTEFRILDALAGEPGRTFARSALLDRISESRGVYDRTLDRHVANLRRKIERDPGNPRYVLTVFGVGYKLAGPP